MFRIPIEIIIWVIYLGLMVHPVALYGVLAFAIFIPLSLIANKIMEDSL